MATYKDSEELPVAAPTRVRGRGIVENLDDYRLPFDYIGLQALKQPVELKKDERKSFVNIGKGRGRLTAKRPEENIRVMPSIEEQCRAVLGSSCSDAALLSLVPKSKGWFSDDNSVRCSTDRRSQTIATSRSDVEVHYSKNGGSDISSHDIVSRSVDEIESGRQEQIRSEIKLDVKLDAELTLNADNNETVEKSDSNSVRIEKDDNSGAQKSDVSESNDRVAVYSGIRGERTNESGVDMGKSEAKVGKGDVRADEIDVKPKEPSVRSKKITFRSSIPTVSSQKGSRVCAPVSRQHKCDEVPQKPTVQSRETTCRSFVSVISKDINRKDSDLGFVPQQQGQECSDVIDNWWDIDTTSKVPSEDSVSRDEPDREVPISKQSSIVSSISSFTSSNQSVYGNWDAPYSSNIRSFDAFGKERRQAAPRFALERDFPVLGATVATTSSIRPPSSGAFPILRDVARRPPKTAKNKQPKQKEKTNEQPKTIDAESVADSPSNARPRSIIVRNLPNDTNLGFVKDYFDFYGQILEMKLLPCDEGVSVRVTFKNGEESCRTVAECLNNTLVPGYENVLSIIMDE